MGDFVEARRSVTLEVVSDTHVAVRAADDGALYGAALLADDKRQWAFFAMSGALPISVAPTLTELFASLDVIGEIPL